MKSEATDLVRRHGGVPYSVPAVREAPRETGEEVARFIARVIEVSMPIVVFLTGPGVGALFQQAERLGRRTELLVALRGVTIVCRGPKPFGALRRLGLTPSLVAEEPYTTPELLAAMSCLELKDKAVGLIHYGERNVPLAEALAERGARLEELQLYQWLLPGDLGPLRALVEEIINGQVDAIAFMSQVEARHLFQVAAGLDRVAELAQALNTKTVVASVGPTCLEALRRLGVEPHVVPEHSKMGHLISALSQYLEQTRSSSPAPSQSFL